MTVLRLDNVDIYKYLRVAPGEGFDPLDTDFREPQFGDSAVGSGDPLLSVAEHNREMQIPVHLNAAPSVTQYENLVGDPELTDWTNYWDGVAGSAVMTVTTEAYDTTWAWRTPSSGHVRWTHDATATLTDFYVALRSLQQIVVSPGETYSFATVLNVIDQTVTGIQMEVLWLTNASAFISSSLSTLNTATGGQGHTITAVAPATAAFCVIRPVRGTCATALDAIEVGIGGVSMVKGSTPVIPFCGDDAGCQWTGTANDSTSLSPTGRVNICRSPNFEDGVSPMGVKWVSSISAGMTEVLSGITDEWSSRGRYSIYQTGNNPTAGSLTMVLRTETQAPTSRTVGRFPCMPGDNLTVRALTNVTNDTPQRLRIDIQFLNVAGATISSGTGTAAAAGTGEREITYTGTFPAACTHYYVRVGFPVGANDSAGFMLDEIVVLQGTDEQVARNEYLAGDALGAKWDATPYSSASIEITGKDGLHQLVSNLNQTLTTLKKVQWRDDGATAITYYDVQFARFEPEYNYRRSQRLWASGLIRIFTKPYGTTGTMRAIGSVMGTGIVVAKNVGSIAGDMPALLEAWVESSSPDRTLTPGNVYGLAAAPSGYVYDIPVASVALSYPSAMLLTPNSASFVMGTRVIFIRDDNTSHLKIGKVNFSPASMYEGRNRVLAIIAAGADKKMQCFDDDERPFTLRPTLATGVGVNDSSNNVYGFTVVDMGVWNVPKNGPRATVGFTIDQEAPVWGQGNPLNANGNFALNRLIVVPEDRLLLAQDYTRRLLAWDVYTMQASNTNMNIAGVDQVGNPYGQPTDVATIPMGVFGQGGFAAGDATSTLHAGGMKISHPTVTDIQVDAWVVLGAAANLASGNSVTIGKWVDGSDNLFGARLHYTQTSGAVLNLLTNSIGGPGGFGTPSVVASKSVASIQGALLSFTTKGPVMQGMVRSSHGSMIATISGSHANAQKGGQTVFGTVGTEGFGLPYVHGFTVSEAPSSYVSLTDYMRVNGRDDWITGWALPSSVTTDMTGIARGRIPQVNSYDNVIALSMSADGASTNRISSVSVFLQERFSYAR